MSEQSGSEEEDFAEVRWIFLLGDIAALTQFRESAVKDVAESNIILEKLVDLNISVGS
ncbi:unnamed protein product [Rhodiola kirilowii]